MDCAQMGGVFKNIFLGRQKLEMMFFCAAETGCVTEMSPCACRVLEVKVEIISTHIIRNNSVNSEKLHNLI